MDLAKYLGKRFTVVITDENDDTVAYSGWMAWEAGETLLLQSSTGTMTLEPDQLARIQPVDTERLQQILPEADFYLPMTILGGKPA